MNRCAALFVLFALAPTAHAVEPPFAGCAWVRAENDSAGTGFLVDEQRRWLITCRHVVGDRDTVDVFFPWLDAGELVTDKVRYLGNRPRLRELGLLVRGKVRKKSDAADLALIELEAFPAGIKAIPLATRPAAIGSALRVVGNRADLDTLWNISTGPLRTRGSLADGYHWRGGKLAVDADVLIGQLPIEEGDSGGPVLNEHGALVGMVSALRRRAPLAAVAISSEEIRTFLDLEEVVNADAQTDAVTEALLRATVWIQPNATQFHRAGVLIEPNLILTSSRGLGFSDCIGVAFPIHSRGKWIGERAPYRDPLDLHLSGHWRAGTVLARDRNRDLALIQVDSIPRSARPVKLAAVMPRPGDAIQAMNHPGGLEFAWVYSAGTVRQRGHIKLADGDGVHAVPVHLFQLPTQAGSPGGPVLNERGELVGVLASREGTQLVGYAATADEIARFLDTAPLDRPARTLEGLLARLVSAPERLVKATARVVDSDTAVSLDPACPSARLKRASAFLAMGRKDEAIRELDLAITNGPFHRDVLFQRATLAIEAHDWRQARGDLERILDPFPADAEARLRLVEVLLGLGKDDEAAAALTDTLRADAKQRTAVANALMAQADVMTKKYPDSPGVAADWLEGASQPFGKRPWMRARGMRLRRA